MRTCKICLLLIFAAALAACSSTGSVNDGAGYARITMAAPTRTYVVQNDIPLAQQIVAHNEQCAKDPLCAK